MAIIVINVAIFSDLRRSALNVNTVVVSQRNIVKFHTSIDDCILHDLTKFHDPTRKNADDINVQSCAKVAVNS